MDGFHERLSRAIGLPGFALVQAASVLATADASGVKLRLLGARGASLAHLLDEDGVELGLTPYQQSSAQIALSSQVGAAIATRDALHPGEYRLLEVSGHRVVLDQPVAGEFDALPTGSDTAACLSNDGSHVAFVFPGGKTLQALFGRVGGALELTKLPVSGSPLACAATNHGAAVLTNPDLASPKNRTVLTSFGVGDPTPRNLPAGLTSFQFCPGTDQLVAQRNGATIITSPRSRQVVIRGTWVSGCTVDDTPWYVKTHGLSWVVDQ
jgi:hypothetical protein